MKLPYDIRVSGIKGSGSGTIDSDLRPEIGRRGADLIESLLLSLHWEGVDINTEEFSRAIETMVEADANNS